MWRKPVRILTYPHRSMLTVKNSHSIVHTPTDAITPCLPTDVPPPLPDRCKDECFYLVSEERGRTANFRFGTFRPCFPTDHDRTRSSARTARRQFAICRSKTFPVILIGCKVLASIFNAGFIWSPTERLGSHISLCRLVNTYIRSPWNTNSTPTCPVHRT